MTHWIVVLALLAAMFMTVFGAVAMRPNSPALLKIGNIGTGSLALLALWHVLWSQAPVVVDMRAQILSIEPGIVTARVAGNKVRGACCPKSALGVIYRADGPKIISDLSFQQVAPTSDATQLRCRPPGQQDFGIWTWRFPADVTPVAVEAWVEHECDGVIDAATRSALGPWSVQTTPR